MILLLREGNEAAFRELVNRFQDRVYNTALGFLQHPEDAEDIAQEVFIQVYRSVGNFKGDALLSTWIYRITVTKSLELIRSRKRKKRFGMLSRLFGEDNRPVHEPIEHFHPGIRQEQKEEAGQLMKLVNELPENQRTAFLLNKIEELSYREIAVIMNTTEAAIDSLLSRARQNLRKKIGKLPP